MSDPHGDDASPPFALPRPYRLPAASAPEEHGARHRAVSALAARRRPILALAAGAVVLIAAAVFVAPGPDSAATTTGTSATSPTPAVRVPDAQTAAGTGTPTATTQPAATAGSAPSRGVPAPEATRGSARPAAPPASSRPGTTSPKPQPATFTAVAGESCTGDATRGYRRSGWSTDWYGGGGGWTGDGCGGGSVSVPMSGSDTVDDNDNVIVWWFKTAPVTTGTCAVSVYVPGTGRALDSAGRPAHYKVYGSTDASGATIATFDLDQTRNQGRWVSARTVAVTGGRLSVRMVTRGVDWGTGRDGAHLGVSALKVACKAS